MNTLMLLKCIGEIEDRYILSAQSILLSDSAGHKKAEYVPLYASEAALPRLREILKNAEQGYVGACGYGATLTLDFVGGEKLTVFKGTDGCDTIVFGSYGGYFLGD